MQIKIKLTRAENCARFSAAKNTIVAMDLERDYLPHVLASEIYEAETRTPMEAKKAQAVAARTYALQHMQSGKAIDDTSTYQVFNWKDLNTIPNCARAVQETAGQVLTYDGQLITAWYSASNGGRTKRSDEVWSEYKPWTVSKEDPWDEQGRWKWGEVKASHGVGMSQIGAAYAASLGESCDHILKIYYPGTQITDGYGKDGETMAKPRASAVCMTSIACAHKQPAISYVWGKESDTQQDCQGHIEYCVRQNGGSMNYAGSNDMFRNACSWVGTIAEAKAKGYDVPGALLFQVKPGGDYPEKYHADGKGNAQHIGYRISLQGIEVIHASSSAGKVTTGNLNSSWTHLGLAKVIDYSEYLSGAAPVETVNAADSGAVMGQMTGVVTADRNGLNMRETPGGAYMLKIPTNAQITISETATHEGELWGKTQWVNNVGAPYTGWVLMSYVELHREESAQKKLLAVVIHVNDQETANHLMGLYSGSYLMEVENG